MAVLRLPKHLGIMMDGNGRWAHQRGLPRTAGHRHGAENLRRVLKACADFGIKVVTLYVFSTENWGRPRDEIEALFELLGEVIDREVERFHREGVRLIHSGSLEGVPSGLAEKVTTSVELTKHNTEFTLNVAFNYGGRADILRAVKRILASGIMPEQLNEGTLASFLSTNGLPDIDLVIRTGGELRLSNFFLWQSAHALFYVTPICWPDFDPAELQRAILWYHSSMTQTEGAEKRLCVLMYHGEEYNDIAAR